MTKKMTLYFIWLPKVPSVKLIIDIFFSCESLFKKIKSLQKMVMSFRDSQESGGGEVFFFF